MLILYQQSVGKSTNSILRNVLLKYIFNRCWC